MVGCACGPLTYRHTIDVVCVRGRDVHWQGVIPSTPFNQVMTTLASAPLDKVRATSTSTSTCALDTESIMVCSTCVGLLTGSCVTARFWRSPSGQCGRMVLMAMS